MVNYFDKEKKKRILDNSNNIDLNKYAKNFFDVSTLTKYSYNFSWLGRPIIQYPQDIVGIQEIIWKVKTDLIIETGIAHGGSIMLSASILLMLDLIDSVKAGNPYDITKSSREVIAVDIDIRKHNKKAILNSFFLNHL